MSPDKSDLSPQLDWGRIRTTMLISVLVLGIFLVLLIGFGFVLGLDAIMCFHILNFRGSVGIPCAIIAAVGIVALLAAGVRGDFTMKLWGLSLEGPSAPITMWVICFMAMSLSLFMLLPEVKSVESLPPALSIFCHAR